MILKVRQVLLRLSESCRQSTNVDVTQLTVESRMRHGCVILIYLSFETNRGSLKSKVREIMIRLCVSVPKSVI